MDNYLIYTDAACDMPAHVFKDYDVRTIPMDYILNGETLSFDAADPEHDKRCDELYAALREGGDVHTSQITPYNYIEAFTPDLEAGHDILYVCFTSGLSATYDNACSAAAELREEFPDRKLIVVNSLSATQGQGVVVTAALMNRAKGMTIEENEAWLNEKIPYMCHRFMVGDLNYLHKGGRVSGAVAVVGTMLNIKPILIINDKGSLDVVGKIRGQKIALKRIVAAYVKDSGVPDVPHIIYVGHTSLYEEVEELIKQIKEQVPEDTIVEAVNLCPIIGAHCGPSFFSVCGWGFHRDAPI